MAPETFVQIVENQQASLTTGPGEPLVLGATDVGEQLAVLEGKQEDDTTPLFIVVTAPTNEISDNRFATEVIPVGSRAVRHPSFDSGARSSWSIALADKRRITMPGERASGDYALVHLGSAAVHPVMPDYMHGHTRQRAA